MAIYHLSAQVIGRSAGRSSVAAAAYRAGERIRDERTGEIHDYTKRHDIEAEIHAPGHAPEWMRERAALWNGVEAHEKRKDAQLAREMNVALPKELNADQQRELVRGFVREEFTRRGMVADVAIHRGDPGNPHVHIMVTMREIQGDGFGPKNREWNRTEQLEAWRRNWEAHANRALTRAGSPERIDHRTLEAQGVRREPTLHEGPAVRAMEAKGIRTDVGERNRAAQARADNLVDFQRAKEALREIKYGEAVREGQKRRAASGLWDAKGQEAVARLERERGVPLTQRGAERRLAYLEDRERRLSAGVSRRAAEVDAARARWDSVRKPAKEYAYWTRASQRHQSLGNVPALILSKRARNRAAYAAGRRWEAAQTYRAACQASGVLSAEDARHRFYRERKGLQFEVQRLEGVRSEVAKMREARDAFHRAEDARWTRRLDERASSGYWDRDGAAAVTRLERERGRALGYDEVRDGHLSAQASRDEARRAVQSHTHEAERWKDYRSAVDAAVADWRRLKADVDQRDGWVGSAMQLVSSRRNEEAKAARERLAHAYREFDGLMKREGFQTYAEYQRAAPERDRSLAERGAALSEALDAAAARDRIYGDAEAAFRRQASLRMARDPDLKARHEARLKSRLYTPKASRAIMAQEALRGGPVTEQTLLRRFKAERDPLGADREVGASLGAHRKAERLQAYREGRKAGTVPRDKKLDKELRATWRAIREDRDPAFKALMQRLEGRFLGGRDRERAIHIPGRGWRV